MRAYRIAVTGVALATLFACAGGVRDEAAPGPYVNDAPEKLMEDRGAFLAAWARDDFEEVATSFSTDAHVKDGDLDARGPRQIQDWLVHQLDECQDLRIEQSEFRRSDPPEQAVMERGHYTMIESHGGATGTYTGRYEIHWVWDGDEYIIHEMALHPGA